MVKSTGEWLSTESEIEQQRRKCPYCADHSMFAPPKGKATDTTWPLVRLSSRFWSEAQRADAHPSKMYKASWYRNRWIVLIPGTDLAKRYDRFSIQLFGMDVGFYDAVPMPFCNYILNVKVKPPAIHPPGATNPNAALSLFSAFVMEDSRTDLRVEGHWWPSHDWIVNQHMQFMPVVDIDKVTVEGAQIALEFFQPETRGAVKTITDERLKDVLSDLGKGATQVAAAAALKVSQTALEKWRRRQGFKTWREVVNRYASP